jgi:hypothetical protein
MHFLLENFGDLFVDMFGEALSRLLVSFGRSMRNLFMSASEREGL